MEVSMGGQLHSPDTQTQVRYDQHVLQNFSFQFDSVSIPLALARFNFVAELVSYCKSDVRLLKEGRMKFQQEFGHLAQLNPIEKYITIASACNRYYRKVSLLPNTIASETISWMAWQRQTALSSRTRKVAFAKTLFASTRSPAHDRSQPGCSYGESW